MVLNNISNLIHITETKDLKHIAKSVAKNTLVSAGLVGGVGSLYNQFVNYDDQMNIAHSMMLSGGMGAGRAILNAFDDEDNPVDIGKKHKTKPQTHDKYHHHNHE